MMRYKLSLLAILAVVALMGNSCGKKSTGVSTTTGWAYNDATNGGFEVQEGVEQQTGAGLVFVEGGTFSMGRVENDITHDWNNIPRRVTVESFYIDETEVRNVDYREYLFWIQRVFAQYPEVYRKALPDTLVWLSKMGYNDPYVENYLRHPAYNEYPVVGVNWLQANDYCAWRTDRVNEQILIERNIFDASPETQTGEENFNTEAYLAGQYVGAVKENLPSLNPNNPQRQVQMEDGILLPKYRLPTEAEWEFAALGLIGNAIDERVYERKIFPWNTHTIRNDQKKYRGQMRANFVRGRGDMMGVAGSLNDGASVTAPVTSYWPNDYGLYCMAGNVNEWVMDIYRAQSFEDMDEFRPYRGNEFSTLTRNPDGTLVTKDSLGRLKKDKISEAEATKKWRRFSKSDYKNVNDGDYTSSIDYTNPDAEKGPGSQRMYSQKTSDMSSLVNDNVRVFKGGSWRDRGYWLSPGSRRFLQEDQSKDDLGFRCAMTRVGSPTANRK